MIERELYWSLLWAQQVLDTPLPQRRVLQGRTARELASLLSTSDHPVVDRVRAALRSHPAPEPPASVVLRCDRHFPLRLRELVDAPFGLFVHGRVDVLDPEAQPIVAIVGSRRPRPASASVARTLARDLAHGDISIASGLAIGVDGIVHRSTIDAGGATIAVLGSGRRHIHPRRHRSLALELVERGGLIVSEYADHLEPRGYRFTARNRIIAGLAEYVVVVQAARRSGSLQTAEFAQQMGVDVGAVPSSIDDLTHLGSTALLRDGADAIVDAGGVLRALGRDPATVIADHEFGALLAAPQRPEEIASVCHLPLPEVVMRLTELEVDGLVARLVDGRYANARH